MWMALKDGDLDLFPIGETRVSRDRLSSISLAMSSVALAQMSITLL